MAEWTIMLHDRIIKQFAIDEGARLTIGRGSDADVVIDNTAISRKHSAIELINGVYFLSDLGSLNGTFVNGGKVEAPTPVAPDDEILVGKFRLAPARTSEGKASTSSSVAFDMGKSDETIFVSSRVGSATNGTRERAVSSKPQHLLTLVEGVASPALVPLDGKASIKIGKDSGCDLVIPGFFVARAQCYIVKRKDNFVIIPQKSWTKTTLNDLKITSEQYLRKGDIIRISRVTIRFD